MSTSKPWNRMQSNAGNSKSEIKFVIAGFRQISITELCGKIGLDVSITTDLLGVSIRSC